MALALGSFDFRWESKLFCIARGSRLPAPIRPVANTTQSQMPFIYLRFTVFAKSIGEANGASMIKIVLVARANQPILVFHLNRLDIEPCVICDSDSPDQRTINTINNIIYRFVAIATFRITLKIGHLPVSKYTDV